MNSSTSTVTSPQGVFESEMARAYCPNSPLSRQQWDPVLRTWRLSKAVQLFPPQHASKADAIFGRGAANEIYSPHNGLFLHEKVEHALNKGYIAIVPDGQRDGLLDYKVVVLDKQSRGVHRRIGRFEVDGFSRYIDLDERRLHFKTDSRPKIHYVWWRYVSAVLQTFYWANSPSWNSKLDRCSEVQWLDSYWRYHGAFVKRNQLMWLVSSGPGPNWTAAFSHGFQEQGDTLYSRPEMENIFRNEHRERQHSPVPDCEEIDEGTQERGHNGEVISGIHNPVASLAPSLANIDLRGDSHRPSLDSPAAIYSSRAFVPAPPYSPDSPPSYSSSPPPLPPSAGRRRQVGDPRLMIAWRANGNTGNNTKTTRTMRTINTVKTSGDEYTARSEVTETATTVSGDDEDEQGEDGGQASEEDVTSMPRLRSGELTVSKLVNLTRFHLDHRTPKPGQEQVHLSKEMKRVRHHPREVDRPYHSMFWAGDAVEISGNIKTTSMATVLLTMRTEGATTYTDIDEWMQTTVKPYTDGEGNGGGNGNETAFEEEITTETITTNGNNGR